MMPALLTRMSASPAWSSSPDGSDRKERRTTFAPALSSASAIAAPRPREAPVTIAVLPSRRNRSKVSELQSEVFARVEERDVLRQPAEHLAVVWEQAAADIVAEQV